MAALEEGRKFVKAEVLYAVRDPSADVEKMLGHKIPVVNIPKIFLFGTQTRFEYEQRKEKDIREDFKRNPTLLDEHPIIACALPAFPIETDEDLQRIREGMPYRIAVTDGHHRVRYSPKSITVVPTRILTVAETLVVHRNLGPHVKYHDSNTSLLFSAAEVLRSWVDETVRSFEDIERPLPLKRTAQFEMKGNTPVLL